MPREKSDVELGMAVHRQLYEKGVENPLVYRGANWQNFYTPMDEATYKLRYKKIKDAVFGILDAFNIDLSDPSMEDTPDRVASMYLDELFSGLDYHKFPRMSIVEDFNSEESLVVVRDIRVRSFCEHHLMPIVGHATIGYISNGKLLGLSKENRLVDFFASRPQVQERLTDQIFHALAFVLDNLDVAVFLHCEHFCVSHRGVEDHGSSTVTSKLSGRFKSVDSLRSEFMQLANRGK